MSTVLLVDDDDSGRTTMSALLEDEGFEVRTAASVAEARSTLSGAGRLDLVLLDQHLGDGLGSELATVVRALQPGVPIVMISGAVDDGMVPLTDAVFQKADAFPALLELIRTILGTAGRMECR